MTKSRPDGQKARIATKRLRAKLNDARALLVDIEMHLETGYRSSDEDDLYDRVRIFLHGKRAAVQ